MAEVKRVYTSSPLGLIPDFLGSAESNDAGKPYVAKNAASVDSIFSSRHKILKRTQTNSNKSGFFSDPLSFGEPTTVHKDDVYDVSTTNILKVLDKYPSMKLKSSDFVYTQDYGVYPNNRLVICRRFGGPCGDDLTRTNAEPTCTLLSWFSDEEPPFTFDFGEVWEPSNDTLKDILNDFGKDISVKAAESSGLGGRLAKLGDAIPLPGITEVLQRNILRKLGIIGDSASKLPSGDPNLIMESSKRKLVSTESPGSGLTGKLKITVTCKWEQKFIAGVDPTFVYYDILRTILSFGGSPATFYLGPSRVASGVGAFLDQLATDPLGLITNFISEIGESLKKIFEKLASYLKGGKVTDEPLEVDSATQTGLDILTGLGNIASEGFKLILQNVTYKYKIRIMAVMNYLTGSPSGPWHVTIGNPMRPILSSGDMTTSNVTVTLGPTLAFNDLPSTIECKFTLESARNLGIDEIFGKLSCGQVRVTLPNPNAGKNISDLKDDNGNPVKEADKIEVVSTLGEPTFYTSDGKPITKPEYEKGESDVAQEIYGIQQIPGAPEGNGGGGGTQSGGVTKVDEDQPVQSGTTDSGNQTRQGFEVNGQNYTYEIESGDFGKRIVVKNSSGRSVYKSSFTGPFPTSDDDLVKGAIENLQNK